MIGNMVETAIFAQWMHRDWFTPYYARWSNGEVDMVGRSDNTLKPIWALEIKWSDRYFEKPKELKSLIKFCQENSIKTPIVTSISKEGEVEFADIHFQFLPSSAYAYTVGKNTLDMKINK
jgi:hypothetical protein